LKAQNAKFSRESGHYAFPATGQGICQHGFAVVLAVSFLEHTRT